MANIVLIASGNNIAKYGYQFLSQNPQITDLKIVNMHMEEAVRYIRQQDKSDIDVIIARGNTARVIRKSRLAYPLVTIPITDVEIIQSIHLAQEKSGKERPTIGYIGLQDVISRVQYFLESMNYTVKYYEAGSTVEIEASIVQAQRDNVDVMIGGVYTCSILKRIGFPYALLESSVSSIEDSYHRAKELQKGVLNNYQKLEEKNTIINSIEDSIVSITDKGKISSINRSMSSVTGKSEQEVEGCAVSALFAEAEEQVIHEVLASGEGVRNHLGVVAGRVFLMNANPVLTRGVCKGVVVVLKDLREFEKMRWDNARPSARYAAYTFDNVWGKSIEITKVVRLAKIFSQSGGAILLAGESGVGKEFFARCMHNAGNSGPFVKVDCTSLGGDAVAKLVGKFDFQTHKYTPGLFALANNGTLYLENVRHLPAAGCSELITLLSDGAVIAQGGREPLHINTRIMASCDCNLYRLAEEGRFRRDLYHMLAVNVLPVPALAQRKEDIPLIAQKVADNLPRRYDGTGPVISPQLSNFLQSREWNGNLDELISYCTRYFTLADHAAAPSDPDALLPDENSLFSHMETRSALILPRVLPEDNGSSITKRKRISKEELDELLLFYKGNRTLMAQKLGISRTTLWKLLRNYGL